MGINKIIIITALSIISILCILVYLLFLKKHMKKYNGYIKYILFTVIPIGVFIKFATEMLEKEFTIFDDRVYKIVYSIASYGMTKVMIFISNLGNPIALAIISIIAIIILLRKKDTICWKVLIINLIALVIMNLLLKDSFARQRPDINRLVVESGYSFPSGHAMISTGFYGYLIYLVFNSIKNKSRYLFSFLIGALIIAICISRIYLGVHYASDVIAGIFAGLSIVSVSCTVLKYIKEHKVEKN